MQTLPEKGRKWDLSSQYDFDARNHKGMAQEREIKGQSHL